MGGGEYGDEGEGERIGGGDDKGMREKEEDERRGE